MPADYSLLQPTTRLNTPFENLRTVMDLRASQEQARGMREQREAIAGQRREATEKAARENAEAAAVRALFARPDQPPTMEELSGVIDPERAAKVFQGFEAVKTARNANEQFGVQHMASILGALESLPTEELRRESYAGTVKTLVESGRMKPGQAPAVYDAAWVKAKRREALTAEQQFEQEKPIEVTAGASLAERGPSGAMQTTYTAPKEATKPASAQEYEYAVAQGFKGSYQDYQDADANRRRPTVDPIARELAELRLADAKRDRDLRGKVAPHYQSVIDRVLMSAPATRRKAIEGGLARTAAGGNEAELKDQIRLAAIEGEPVDARAQVNGRMATMASLADTRAILREMKAKGVPTGWLTGNVEDLLRRVGTSSNPEYVALANRLQGTLINYRRAATGVAFGEREAAQYERMFPNYRNQLPVNEALIDGLEREMRTYDRTYWESKLGKDGYALVFGQPNGDASPAGATPKRVRYDMNGNVVKD